MCNGLLFWVTTPILSISRGIMKRIIWSQWLCIGLIRMMLQFSLHCLSSFPVLPLLAVSGGVMRWNSRCVGRQTGFTNFEFGRIHLCGRAHYAQPGGWGGGSKSKMSSILAKISSPSTETPHLGSRWASSVCFMDQCRGRPGAWLGPSEIWLVPDVPFFEPQTCNALLLCCMNHVWEQLRAPGIPIFMPFEVTWMSWRILENLVI